MPDLNSAGQQGQTEGAKNAPCGVTLTYSQSLGTLVIVDRDGKETLLATGCWAGIGQGKNNPDMQHVSNTGPLPRGWYTIGDPEDASTGPYSLRLTPVPGTDMFGRSHFLIHGAAKDPAQRGNESHGCIIAPRAVRVSIHERGIKYLQVVR